MNTTSVGREAESFVAKQLAAQGYKLIEQNWRTRWCEIDLIMEKSNTVYFIEVKYRSSSVYGSGLEYITPKKLSQMKFAAEYWLSKNTGCDETMLAAVEVTPHSKLIDLVELW
jgi:uncharacterized protein (TIGR00252 family)